MARRKRSYPPRSFPSLQAVDRATAETADFVVCMRLPDTTGFRDNLSSACTRCGHGIYFRPDCPSLPLKVCLQCSFAIVIRA